MWMWVCCGCVYRHRGYSRQHVKVGGRRRAKEQRKQGALFPKHPRPTLSLVCSSFRVAKNMNASCFSLSLLF